ncbi:hypothetical protein ZYGR_0AK04710 [Zygosaccharomyces rouxii]|uniref:J domain-containing protein n=1 Tax=Zygosaccharomyces rouxii TaxID=4956 RepID=A0A1Q3ADY3_ZYGRO|nr:hypothetical protein ZYGR_0AK04710 [Zygosaccharomyces rouxii]
MALNYDYDETSETWPFFLLTLLLVILVPLTLSQVYRLFNDSIDSQAIEDPRQRSIERKLEQISDSHTESSVWRFRQAFSKRSSKIWQKRNIVIIVGWVLVAMVVQSISQNDSIQDSRTVLFDPYEILGVSASAADREIKSAYRKLSVKFHPDKLGHDLAPEVRTKMEEMYVQITKAYESLTDENVKENYLRYGHPDGPQSTSHGIALPRFLVDGAASPLVVLSYIVLLALIMPYFVSQWWSRTQAYTNKGIHTRTASHFVDRLINYKPSEVITVELIIHWLSEAYEFELLYPNLTTEDFEQILLNHINRRDSSKIADANAKHRIVAKCHSLLHGLLDIACGFRNTDIAIFTIETFKCIVQAVPHTPYRQILQLPNVNKTRFLEGLTDDVRTVGKLFTYDDKKIGQMLGIDDEDLLKETLDVAANIPQLRLLKADFVVPGEKQVTPLSTPHISVKLLVHSAKQRVIPVDKFPPEMLEDPQDFENQRDPFAVMEQEPLISYSYAPYFPIKRRNAFCCLVGLQKDGKLIQTPVVVQKLSLVNLDKDLDKRTVKELGPSFKPEEWKIATIKLPLGQQAPAENGDVYFRVIIKSTDYFATDLDFSVCMHVTSAPVQEPQEVEEDEETENDSAEEDEEEDDEEGSDSDYSDIDTDTEVEEDSEKVKNA